MSLSSLYKTDNQKEVSGVEIPYPANDDGTIPSFIIRRSSSSNPHYVKALEEAIRPYKQLQRAGSLEAKLAVKITNQAFIKGCLVGWNNVTYGDIVGGSNQEKAPFTEENAIKLFERLPDLSLDLQEQASQISTFREVELEGDAKN